MNIKPSDGKMENFAINIKPSDGKMENVAIVPQVQSDPEW